MFAHLKEQVNFSNTAYSHIGTYYVFSGIRTEKFRKLRKSCLYIKKRGELILWARVLSFVRKVECAPSSAQNARIPQFSNTYTFLIRKATRATKKFICLFRLKARTIFVNASSVNKLITILYHASCHLKAIPTLKRVSVLNLQASLHLHTLVPVETHFDL